MRKGNYLLTLAIIGLSLSTVVTVTGQGIAWAPGSEAAYRKYVNEQKENANNNQSRFRNFSTPRWTTTATNGSGLEQGDPTTLTWSVAPNGTFIPNGVGEGSGTSNLITRLDQIYHGGDSPGGADLTQRTWWGLMNQTFSRYSALSGLSYVYSADDGANFFGNGGVLGVRGDVRIGGKTIDGNSGILAYNYGPNGGDMVIDTADNFYNNLNGNSLRFRNVFAHEHGHGVGQAHVIPTDNTKLMEPFINLTFDGPQFDEILNMHRWYGDVYEKSNGGVGNDVFSNATALGTVGNGGTVQIGTDAVGLTSSLLASESAVDFISIDGTSDVDYLSFSVDQDALVDISLTPVGPTYLEGPQGGSTSSLNTARLSNLVLSLFDTDGTTLIGQDNSGGLGEVDQLLDQNLIAGTYFIRVSGLQNQVQMYHLAVSANFTAIPEPGTLGICMLAIVGLGLSSCRRRS